MGSSLREVHSAQPPSSAGTEYSLWQSVEFYLKNVLQSEEGHPDKDSFIVGI